MKDVTLKQIAYLEFHVNKIVTEMFKPGEDMGVNAVDKIFKLLCDEMLKSDDVEIKVHLSQWLMFKGFIAFLQQRHEHAEEFIKMREAEGDPVEYVTYGTKK